MERAPATDCIGGWVGPRAVLDAVMKRKIPSPRRTCDMFYSHSPIRYTISYPVPGTNTNVSNNSFNGALLIPLLCSVPNSRPPKYRRSLHKCDNGTRFWYCRAMCGYL